MSHFTTIKTSFVSKEHLRKALADVSAEFGLTNIRENSQVRGFGRSVTNAELVVSTRNQGYDIGFRSENGVYALIADWYGIKDLARDMLTSRLSQRYAYHAVKEKLDGKGFAVVEEEVGEEKTIHLRVRRAV